MNIKRLLLVLLFLLCGTALAEESKYSSELGIKYDKSKGFPIVIFQDGLFFGEARALQCAEALSSRYLLPTGIVELKHNNSSPGMTVADALLEKTYRHLDELWGANNQRGLLVLYMGGATQFERAVRVGKLYGRKYENFRVIPVEEAITPEQLRNLLNERETTDVHPCIRSFDNKEIVELLNDWKSHHGGASLRSSVQPIAPRDASQAARP